MERVKIVDKKINYKIVIWCLRFCYFSYYFSVGCIQTFYPIVLNKIKVPNSQIGIMTSIGLMGGTISPIIVGFLADKTKKSRFILITLSLFTFIFHTIPILAITIKTSFSSKRDLSTPVQVSSMGPFFIYFLYLAQFFITFGDQGTKALMDGVTHKVLGEARKAGHNVDFSRVRMCGGLGLGSTSAIAGFALDYVKKAYPGFPEEVCLITTCLFVGLLYVLTMFMYIPDAETKEDVSFFDAIRDIAHRTDVIICYMTQFLLQFAANITKSFDTLYIKHLGGNKTITGLATCVGYFIDVSMMYFSPIITKAVGSKEVTVGVSSMISSARTLLYAFADTFYMAFNNAILTGFSMGLTIPTMSTLVKSKAPDNLISSYVSLLTGCGKIGASIGTFLGGYISEKQSYNAIYIMSSAFFALGALLLMIYYAFFDKKASEINKNSELNCKEEKVLMLSSEEPITTDVFASASK